MFQPRIEKTSIMLTAIEEMCMHCNKNFEHFISEFCNFLNKFTVI